MSDPTVRDRVHAVLDAVAERPNDLPLGELTELHRCGVDVEIDRRRDGAVIFIAPRPDPRLAPLSDREREVAALLAEGHSNQQIAAALYVSVPTVKDHVHSILTKTGLSSRSQVIAAWYGGLRRDDQMPVDHRGVVMRTSGSPASSGPTRAR